MYEYYFQDKNGNFSILDTFPLQHGILAEDINIENKTVTTKSIVGCCHYNLNKYKLNANGSWLTSSKQIEIKKWAKANNNDNNLRANNSEIYINKEL